MPFVNSRQIGDHSNWSRRRRTASGLVAGIFSRASRSTEAISRPRRGGCNPSSWALSPARLLPPPFCSDGPSVAVYRSWIHADVDDARPRCVSQAVGRQESPVCVPRSWERDCPLIWVSIFPHICEGIRKSRRASGVASSISHRADLLQLPDVSSAPVRKSGSPGTTTTTADEGPAQQRRLAAIHARF